VGLKLPTIATVGMVSAPVGPANGLIRTTSSGGSRSELPSDIGPAWSQLWDESWLHAPLPTRRRRLRTVQESSFRLRGLAAEDLER
jgi:hypothetical protein